jgi:ABC-2 type transport system permease protein
VSALASMTRMETKLFLREPVFPLLVLALPVLLLVGFGLIPGFGDPSADLGGQSGTEYIASLGVGIVLSILGLSILPTTLATYRERVDHHGRGDPRGRAERWRRAV